MNSADTQRPPESQRSGAGAQTCFICNYPIESCFCQIPVQGGKPILLCCPDCTMQYLDAKHPPADTYEEQLRAYEKSTRFFIGEDKPWL